MFSNITSFKQVSDVVPVACRAAADAGIRSVCVTNFRYYILLLELVYSTKILLQ